MSTVKKALAIILVLSMVFALSVPAFAQVSPPLKAVDKEAEQQIRSTKDPFPIELPVYTGKSYEFYTFLGDSVPAGGALWYDASGKDIGEYGFMRIN